MIRKNIIGAGLALAVLAGLAGTAYAEGTGTTTPPHQPALNPTTIACVRTAVTNRESSLDSAIGIYTQSVNTAYSTRASALASAYTLTDRTSIRNAVRAAWSAFNSSMKSARKAWQSARESAWNTFRTASRTCKVPSDISDQSNMGSDVSGN